MMGRESTAPPGMGSQAVFGTTHWSVVLAAGDEETPESAAALEQLCQAYWYPLYAFVRKQGYSPDDAQDLTQGFFAHILSRHFLRRANREKGKFRSYVLASLRYFLADEWARFHAQKRGSGRVPVSFDAQTAEAQYQNEPADRMDAEKIFERRWALVLLDRVLDRLDQELLQADKKPVFDQLRGFLIGERGPLNYSEAGSRLGMSEGAVKVAVHRMRQRYRELFREEVAHTVGEPSEIDEEIRHIFSILSS
jgi:RNA polymerase sigma-70 factor (ECF subfamily)